MLYVYFFLGAALRNNSSLIVSQILKLQPVIFNYMDGSISLVLNVLILVRLLCVCSYQLFHAFQRKSNQDAKETAQVLVVNSTHNLM